MAHCNGHGAAGKVVVSTGARRLVWSVLAGGLMVVLLGGILAWRSMARHGEDVSSEGRNTMAGDSPPDETQLRKLCSHCHLFAEPNVLPRSLWADTVGKMSRMAGYGSNVVNRPATAAVARWFQERAPQQLPLPNVETTAGPGRLRMRKYEIRSPSTASGPCVSCVRLIDLVGDARPEILLCDMRNGLLLMGRTDRPGWTLEPVGRVANPAHAEFVDLDADGHLDLLVADLGSFLAMDHNLGSVEWFRQSAEGNFERITLASGLGRVADVQPGDFDGDGDLDLVVGEFGWLATGHLLLLENRTRQWSHPVFVSHQIDGHHGASHVPVTDLDGDGLPDIVVLYSQEHEMVRCYLNRGELRFELRDVYRAPHPAWGSTSIQLIDLDGDADLDMLLTNGDSYDNSFGLLKPYHCVRWLENRGALRFESHNLVRMYGAYRAEAADMDGDGDRDIVACALVELNDRDNRYGQHEIESILWIEQTAPGQFLRRSLEVGQAHHPTLTLGDYDLDGDIDLLVGNGQFDDSATPIGSTCLDIWENQQN